MKKTLSLSIVAMMFIALATVTSCTKDPITIFYSIPDKEACIPAKSNNATAYTQEFAVSNSDIQSAFTNAGITYDESRIKSAEIKDLHVTASASGVNFDDFIGMHVYVRLASQTATENVKIADATTIGSGVADVTLAPYGVDLKEYVGQDLVLTIEVFSKSTGNAAKCVKLTTGKFSITIKP